MHVLEWLWRWWGYVPANEMSAAWRLEQRRLAVEFDGVSWRWPVDKSANERGAANRILLLRGVRRAD